MQEGQRLAHVPSPEVTPLVSRLDDVISAIYHSALEGLDSYNGGNVPLRDLFQDQLSNADVATYQALCGHLFTKLSTQAAMSDSARKLGVAMAVAQVLDLQLAGDDTAKFTKLSALLDENLATADDNAVLKFTGEVYGQLWSAAMPGFASHVELKIKDQVEALVTDAASDLKKLAALTLLTEAATRIPSIFLSVLNDFCDNIFVTLVHKQLAIRVASAKALQAAAQQNEKRQTRSRSQCTFKMWSNLSTGLKWLSPSMQLPPAHQLHGLLLGYKELIMTCDNLYYLVRGQDELFLYFQRYKDFKDPLVRSAVIALIPAMATAKPTIFVKALLQPCIDHLLLSLAKHPSEKATIFTALGDTVALLTPCWRAYPAGTAAKLFSAFCKPLTDTLLASTPVRRGRGQSDPPAAAIAAIECIGKMAAVVPLAAPNTQAQLLQATARLLEPMTLTGLSKPLVAALSQVKSSIPELENRATQLLLDISCWVLTAPRAQDPAPPPRLRTYPHAAPLASYGGSMATKFKDAFSDDGIQPDAQLTLALDTLAEQLPALPPALTPLLSVEFMRDVLADFLRARAVPVYRAAVTACVRVSSALCKRYRTLGPAADMHMGHLSGHTPAMEIIDATLTNILLTGTNHPHLATRGHVIREISSCSYVIQRLENEAAAKQLLTFLPGDAEPLKVVQLLVRIGPGLGVLVDVELIKRLKTLLTYLSHTDPIHTRIRNARHLQYLLWAAPDLGKEFHALILQTLTTQINATAKLYEDSRKAQPDSEDNWMLPQEVQGGDELLRVLLSCVGVLAEAMGAAFTEHAPTVLSLVYHHLETHGQAYKKAAVVRVIGQIMKATGSTMVPYMDYPRLLNHLLRMLLDDSPVYRESAAATLGVIGALDPYVQKLNQASIAGEGRLEKEGVRPIENKTHPGPTWAGTLTGNHLAPDEQQEELIPVDQLAASSEDYYPTLSINNLMRVLRDPSMKSQHVKAVNALTTILFNLGQQAVPYLDKVMPALFSMMRTNDQKEFREMMLRELQPLVISLRAYLNKFLEEIFRLLSELWYSDPDFPRHALSFLAQAARTLRETMAPLLQDKDLNARFREILNNGVMADIYPLLRLFEQMDCFGEEAAQKLWPRILWLFHSNWPSDEDRVKILASLQAILAHMVRPLPFYHEAFRDLCEIVATRPPAVVTAALDAVCAAAINTHTEWETHARKIEAAYRSRGGPRHEWFERLLLKTEALKHPSLSSAPDWEHSNGFAYEEDVLFDLRRLAADRPPYEPRTPARLKVTPSAISKAAEACMSCSGKKEDWYEWLRTFSLELIYQSPSPALRACHEVAKVHPQMTRELFKVAFQSCWLDLPAGGSISGDREKVVSCYSMILMNPEAPPEIKAVMLSLEEFMQLDEKDIGVSKPFLAKHARECGNFAKALHHEEDVLEEVIKRYLGPVSREKRAQEKQNVQKQVELLVNLNKHMGEVEGAQGVVHYVQKRLPGFKTLSQQPRIQWYLGQWEQAITGFEKEKAKLRSNVRADRQKWQDLQRAQVNCHHGLMDFEGTSDAAQELLTFISHNAREIGSNYHLVELKAMSEWYLGQTDKLKTTLALLKDTPSYLRPFLQATEHAVLGDTRKVVALVREARGLLAQQVVAPLGESYERAYAHVVNLQVMNEVEELSRVMAARRGHDTGLEEKIKRMWEYRLVGVQQKPAVWQALLTVHRQVLPPREDEHNWITFAKLCRTSGRIKRARAVLVDMLGYDPAQITDPSAPGYGSGSGRPTLMLAFLKTMWQQAEVAERPALVPRLQQLLEEVDTPEGRQWVPQIVREDNNSPGPSASLRPVRFIYRDRPPIAARAALTLGRWRWSLLGDPTTTNPTTPTTPPAPAASPFTSPSADVDAAERDILLREDILRIMGRAVDCSAEHWFRAWHWWAHVNLSLLHNCESCVRVPVAKQALYASQAITGYFKALATAQSQQHSSQQQDLLRLITLWFRYEQHEEVAAQLQESFQAINVTTWLKVIPQLLARIHHGCDAAGSTNTPITELLTNIGIAHPHALLFPLLVVKASSNVQRVQCAEAVLEQLRGRYSSLVKEAEMVARELNRVAILWPERWHEALEEASRLYFGEQKVTEMMEQLLPLHAEIEEVREGISIMEQTFLQRYGDELRQAHQQLLEYQVSQRQAELQAAWDLYYNVFRSINRLQQSLSTLELAQCSPDLHHASSLQLAVPGTYIGESQDEPLVRIAAFSPEMQVLSSKQRPRRLTISGSDLKEYQFLLKGHEDLRLDERVMQLFGLVNTLLARDRSTSDKDLAIGRFAVVPLTPRSGLIGWLLNTDTMHVLIRAYREARDIQLNLEHKRMTHMAPDLEDKLPVINKVEVFLHAVDENATNNKGDDLQRVLWLNSRGSETWLDRRTNFTRSTAVMSMVGYVLGLGDRHPSNLLIDRYTGKLLHIDFGDCFEQAMRREKFPEKWPFRLTRMMVKAMGPTGVEGNFRLTCEAVVGVQRRERDSLLAMLEAFVYDPLIHWRLPALDTDQALAAETDQQEGGAAAAAAAGPPAEEDADWVNAEGAGADGAAVAGGEDGDVVLVPAAPPGARAPRVSNDLLSMLERDNEKEANKDEYIKTALRVMKRINSKLYGTEFTRDGRAETVGQQVARLIDDAQSVENLCQAYVGWCPFW